MQTEHNRLIRDTNVSGDRDSNAIAHEEDVGGTFCDQLAILEAHSSMQVRSLTILCISNAGKTRKAYIVEGTA